MISKLKKLVRIQGRDKKSPPKPEHFYDIIGDVHGYAYELEHLLQKLGYTTSNGSWSHPTRMAIFIGDFINRGPDSRKVIAIIRNMVESGKAMAILGNHEVNAILYFTYNKDGLPIKRPRSANRKILEAVKKEYGTSLNDFYSDIKWMRRLPLFLELGKIRVVHAYWSDAHINKMKEVYLAGKLTKKFLRSISRQRNKFYKPFWETLKGIEFRLPKDLVIKDSDKVQRSSFRIKWWINGKGQTFRAINYESKFLLPDYTVPDQLIKPIEIYPQKAPPVFIGHYCMGNGNLLPTHNVCCVDACIANNGRLAAYRWNGETTLDESNFVFTPKRKQLAKLRL